MRLQIFVAGKPSRVEPTRILMSFRQWYPRISRDKNLAFVLYRSNNQFG